MSEKILLNAAKGHRTQGVPVWLMRQAGRYLPEYRKYRTQYDTLTMFKTPRIATEITLQPLRRFPLDAAIIYADILLIPDALGLKLTFVEQEGPQFEKTIRSNLDLKIISEMAEKTEQLIDKLDYVRQTIENVKQKLTPTTTLIGFAGAPFTVASYMVEGGSSKKGLFFETKKLMFNEPHTFRSLMEMITRSTIAYLKMQIQAGAEVIQLFESWSGALSPDQYKTMCLPYVKQIVSEIKEKAPVILFFGQGAPLLQEAKEVAPNFFGVDWRQDLSSVSHFMSSTKIGLQGNLDPLLLFAPKELLHQKIEECLAVGTKHPHGFIFNLGHGCLPNTPVENIDYLIRVVKGF